MKVVKTILKVLLGILAFVVLVVLALPLWIGPVVTGAANSIVPKKAKTDFNLNEFALNPYSGTAHVGDMKLANPEGFSKENCVELGDVNVKLDMSTVLSKKIRIEKVELNGLTIVIEKNGKNFEVLAANFSESDDESAKDESKSAEETKDTSAKEENAGVQIDRLILKNVTVKYAKIPFPIPTLELTDIGADSPEGATWTEVCVHVYTALMKSVGAVGDLGKELFKTGKDSTGKAIDATKDTVKSIEGAVDAAEETFKSFKDVFKKARKESKKNK